MGKIIEVDYNTFLISKLPYIIAYAVGVLGGMLFKTEGQYWSIGFGLMILSLIILIVKLLTDYYKSLILTDYYKSLKKQYLSTEEKVLHQSGH